MPKRTKLLFMQGSFFKKNKKQKSYYKKRLSLSRIYYHYQHYNFKIYWNLSDEDFYLADFLVNLALILNLYLDRINISTYSASENFYSIYISSKTSVMQESLQYYFLINSKLELLLISLAIYIFLQHKTSWEKFIRKLR